MQSFKFAQPDLILSASQQASASPLLSEMPSIIRGWTNLTFLQFRDLRSAVSIAARICAIPDANGPPGTGDVQTQPTMSCAYLNTKLFRQAPALYGFRTPKHFANVLTRLRVILRRLDLHDLPWAGYKTLGPAWRALYDALPTEHRKIAMSAFMRFCDNAGIAPETVTSGVLAQFEVWLLDRTLCRDAPVRARTTAANWTWARGHVEGWPDIPLTRPRMRAQYVLPLSIYPVELQADVERFLGRLACNDPGDIYEDDAATDQSKFCRRRALKPRTVEGRRFQIRQCLAAMVIEGRDPTTITALADLVSPPEQALSILRFFMARAGGKITAQTGGIGELLRQLARFHCRLSPKDVAQITRWSKNAAPKQVFAMSEKNMQRLQPLLVPHNRLKLLNLPRTLMNEASAAVLQPRAAALLAMNAVALDILFAFPVRRSNLAGLRTDRHLQRTDPRSRLVDFITVPADETKTGVALSWPLPADVAQRLGQYLKIHHPNLTVPGNPFLFPKMTTAAGRSPTDLAIGLTQVVEQRLGCRFNIHLMRHFIVALHLEHNPGQYDVARHLLGHAKASYTVAVYDGFGAQAAARQLDATLTHMRAAARPKAAIPPMSRRRGASR